MSNTSKSYWRKKIRQQRRQLSKQELGQYAHDISRQLYHYRPFLTAQAIGSYFAMPGELDTTLLHQRFSHKRFYFPRVLHTRKRLMRFTGASLNMQTNVYGIAENQTTQHLLKAANMDAILVPLVGFSRDGSRLGMGGGFYDRFCQMRHNDTTRKRPFLIGLAYDFQEIAMLDSDPWDVKLDAIITNREIIKIH